MKVRCKVAARQSAGAALFGRHPPCLGVLAGTRGALTKRARAG